jgi:hypothetical protein
MRVVKAATWYSVMLHLIAVASNGAPLHDCSQELDHLHLHEIIPSFSGLTTCEVWNYVQTLFRSLVCCSLLLVVALLQEVVGRRFQHREYLWRNFGPVASNSNC